jgi:callose synthase
MQRPVALVGAREHVFTSTLSTTAQLMAYQELQFGTVVSRLMYSPLRVRCHYGHPDYASKLFFQSRGGFAKASKVRPWVGLGTWSGRWAVARLGRPVTRRPSQTINVSEDVFAGFNAMLRGGESKHVEYIQLGKVGPGGEGRGGRWGSTGREGRPVGMHAFPRRTHHHHHHRRAATSACSRSPCSNPK